MPRWLTLPYYNMTNYTSTTSINKIKSLTRPSMCTNYNNQFITRPSSSTINIQQWTPILPRPPTAMFPMNYHTIQGTQQPFTIGPYLAIQYQLEQNISPQVLNFIPMYFPGITVTLTNPFINLLANEANFVHSSPHVSIPLKLDGDTYQEDTDEES